MGWLDDRSELNPMGTIDNLEELAIELGCRIGCLPIFGFTMENMKENKI